MEKNKKTLFSQQLKYYVRLIHMRAVNTKDQLLMYILKMDHLLSPIFMKLKINLILCLFNVKIFKIKNIPHKTGVQKTT